MLHTWEILFIVFLNPLILYRKRTLQSNKLEYYRLVRHVKTFKTCLNYGLPFSIHAQKF